MNQFSSFTIFYIILTIIGTSLFWNTVYTVFHHGRFIIKVKENKGLDIFWVGLLILWGIVLFINTSDYIHYEGFRAINYILQSIFWIEISILNIIRSSRSSEIREHGIYIYGDFYKWSKIKSYSWVLPNTLQLKVNTFLKVNKSFELAIDEEVKLKVNEVIQRNLDL